MGVPTSGPGGMLASETTIFSIHLGGLWFGEMTRPPVSA